MLNPDAEHFGRYLLDELFWELEQHPTVAPDLPACPREEIQVISHARNELRFRLGETVYRGRLTWRRDEPPTLDVIEPLDSMGRGPKP